MTRQNKNKNITSGNLFAGIISFTIPLFLSTLVQTLFTSADTIIVGNFANSLAVAALGAAQPVISLLVGCFVSFATGAGIIISRSIGAGDKERIKKAVDTSMIFSVVLGIIVMVASFLLSTALLEFLDCPQECFDDAVYYMNIYMLGVPVMMIYNFAAAIIRAEGDSTRPLIYIIISGAVNVILNLIFCIILANKIAAVGYSTVLSQVVAAILVMVRLMRKKDGLCTFSLRKMNFHFPTLYGILRFGIPLALSSAVYPLAGLQIQPAINSYGPANLAGVTAATNIDGFANALQSAFSGTLVTFASQNIGAHNRARTERSIVLCTLCATISGLVFGFICYYLLSDQLMALFLKDDMEAIFYGQMRMKYVTAFMWLSALNGCIGATVQALGYPMASTLNGLISVLGFRIIWMNFVYPYNQNIDTLYVCYTISWSLMFIIGFALFIPSFMKYRKGERMYEEKMKRKQQKEEALNENA